MTSTAFQKDFTSIVETKDNYNKVKYFNNNWIDLEERFYSHPDDHTSNSVTFEIAPNEAHVFTDLSHTKLLFSLQFVKKDGSVITEKDVGLINFFAQTQIESIKVFANSVKSWDSSEFYSELAFIKGETEFTLEEKKTVLASQGWFSDVADNISVAKFTKNVANANRALFFATLDKDKKMTYSTDAVLFTVKPLGGIFEADNLLPPNIPLRIEIVFKPPEYVTFTDTANEDKEFILKRKEVKMKMRNLRSNETYYKKYLSDISQEPYKMTYTTVTGKRFVWGNNSLSFEQQLKGGQGLNPREIIVVMRDQTLIPPNRTKNPLNFTTRFEAENSTEAAKKSVHINSLKLMVGGQEICCHGNLTPNYKSYMNAHYDQFNQHFFPHGGGSLDKTDYVFGRYIIPFDMTLTRRIEDYDAVRQPLKKGDIWLSASLNALPKHSIEVLVFFVWDSNLKIDKNLNVTYLEKDPV